MSAMQILWLLVFIVAVLALATLTGHSVLVAVSWEALLMVYIMVKALGGTGLVK